MFKPLYQPKLTNLSELIKLEFDRLLLKDGHFYHQLKLEDVSSPTPIQVGLSVLVDAIGSTVEAQLFKLRRPELQVEMTDRRPYEPVKRKRLRKSKA